MHRKKIYFLGAVSATMLLCLCSKEAWANPHTAAAGDNAPAVTEEAVSDTKDENYGIANVATNLNIREGAGTGYTVIGKLPKAALCQVINTQDGWSYITSGEVQGYVCTSYLITGIDPGEYTSQEGEHLELAHWTGGAVEVESPGEPVPQEESAEGNQTGEPEETEPAVTPEQENAALPVEENTVEQPAEEEPSQEDAQEDAQEAAGAVDDSQNIRFQMVDFAQQFLGNPYVWGGTSLTDGADCSGFVQSIYANFGYSLPRVSRDQAETGTKISVEEAQPGDLIFYAKDGEIYHVVMYIGDGQVIHASSKSTGIKISNIYYDNAVWAVRILDE